MLMMMMMILMDVISLSHVWITGILKNRLLLTNWLENVFNSREVFTWLEKIFVRVPFENFNAEKKIIKLLLEFLWQKIFNDFHFNFCLYGKLFD